MSETQSDMERLTIDEKRQSAAAELKKLESNHELYDYYLNAGPTLYEYYDIQEKIQSGIAPTSKRVTTKQKPGSVLAALETAAQEGGTPPAEHSKGENKGETLRRDKLLEVYLQKVDPEHARSSHEIEYERFGD